MGFGAYLKLVLYLQNLCLTEKSRIFIPQPRQAQERCVQPWRNRVCKNKQKMPEIIIETRIKSSIEICFDLSRSIDLHKISTAETNEKAIGGITNGLINLNEFVTWQATHFGIKQKLTSKITKFESPNHFRDEQQKGIFKFLIHDHYFESQNGITIMNDIFNFQSSFGFLGIIFDKYVLTKYLTKLLIQRNKIIKEFAETQKWKTILNG